MNHRDKTRADRALLDLIGRACKSVGWKSVGRSGKVWVTQDGRRLQAPSLTQDLRYAIDATLTVTDDLAIVDGPRGVHAEASVAAYGEKGATIRAVCSAVAMARPAVYPSVGDILYTDFGDPIGKVTGEGRFGEPVVEFGMGDE